MTDAEKDVIIERILDGFDFEEVWSVEHIKNKYRPTLMGDPSIEDMKKHAEKILRMALDHQDREFWWAGGLTGRGGLCACYDNKWGLSLNYILTSNLVKMK